MILFHDTHRPAPLVEREGLAHFLASTTEKPKVLTSDQRAALSRADLSQYNRQRVAFLSGGIVVQTPALLQAKLTLKKLLATNLDEHASRRGLMISGDSTAGKTTIAKALMKYIHSMYSRQFPDYEAAGHTPVVYIEVPPGSTGKLLMKTFARFFGLTVTPRENMGDIQERVVKALRSARTQVVIVDELHNLNAANRGNGESIDVLKSLHNQVPATFVYAGSDLADGPLLRGTRGRQLSGRFIPIQLSRYNPSDTEQLRTWRGIVKKFEDALPLADHEPGTIVKLSSHLHHLSNGSIGTLAQIITGAAIELILDPAGRAEAITKELLDTQERDIAAEAATIRKMQHP